MALIRESILKKESSYTTIFSDVCVANLFTQAHSAMIRAGNELEELLTKHTRHSVHPPSKKKKSVYYEDLILPMSGCTFIPKLTVKGYPGVENTNLDIAVADGDSKIIYTIEMKDGSNFDTKKSKAEREKLQNLTAWLSEMHPDWTVVPKIILWQCRDISDASFKDKLAQPWLTTGRSAESILGVTFDCVEQSRKAHRDQNVKDFLLEARRLLNDSKKQGDMI